MATPEPRVNGAINVSMCRLINQEGKQLGIFALADAQRVADEEGLDLVEIAPNAEPPVCRIMDYGKYKYTQAMEAKQARKKQTRIETKEMKFRPKIDVGDYETKKKHILRFLAQGNKVKVTIMFRGREMAHPEQGRKILDKLSEDLQELATIEAQPKMEGRNMYMMIAPLNKKASSKKKKEKEAPVEEAPAPEAEEPAEA